MNKIFWLFVWLTLSILVTTGGNTAALQETVIREIAFTIDDLPVNYMTDQGVAGWEKVTSKLLISLEKNNVPAIGFVNLGKLYDKNGRLDNRRLALLKRWLDAGFELGNHTFSHLDLHKTSLAEFTQDLLKGEGILRNLCKDHGRDLAFFRHPLLHTGLDLETKNGLEQFLMNHGYRIAPVTMDNSEWIYARAYDIANGKADIGLKKRIATAYLDYMERVFAYYEDQSRTLFGREVKQVLLIHANTLNSEYLGDLARLLKTRGYTFISLAKALEDEAYMSLDRYTGTGGITWLHRWALTQGKKGDFFKGEPEVDEFVNAVYQGKY
ncbi:MAG: polysaccharide deacetylase family protein [Candidatus Aminicenantes bacterium]|nr:MAG: polysaccharide deacetylase family protein [Candidatus Aminicenantes bacterium]